MFAHCRGERRPKTLALKNAALPLEPINSMWNLNVVFSTVRPNSGRLGRAPEGQVLRDRQHHRATVRHTPRSDASAVQRCPVAARQSNPELRYDQGWYQVMQTLQFSPLSLERRLSAGI